MAKHNPYYPQDVSPLPKREKTVNLRLSLDLHLRLERECARLKVSRSAFLEELLRREWGIEK